MKHRTLKDPITFGKFHRLVGGRGWTPATLAEKLRDIEAPKAFFHRVWDPHEENTVIPYRTVLEFYFAQKRLVDGQKGRGNRTLRKMGL